MLIRYCYYYMLIKYYYNIVKDKSKRKRYARIYFKPTVFIYSCLIIISVTYMLRIYVTLMINIFFMIFDKRVLQSNIINIIYNYITN